MKPLKLLALLSVIALIAAACATDASDDTPGPAGDAPAAEDTTPPAEAGVDDSDDGADAADEGRLSVVVTTNIWGDIVSNIVGDDADIEILFPIGADPHDYQMSSAQAAAMESADLVVVNGLALEEGVLDVVEGLEEDGANVVEVALGVELIAFGGGGHDHEDEDHAHEEDEDHDHEDEDHAHEEDEDHAHEEELVCDPGAGHDHEGEEDHSDEEEGHEGHNHAEGSCDPHVWMDPLRVAEAVEMLAAELTALDSSIDWMARASAYADELRALDAEVVALLGSIPEDQRKLVTNHDAFGYFADRYDFEVIGTVIPSGTTLADPSSAELAELVEILVDENISVIFAETIEPSALADAVADEVGAVTVVELFTGSLGGPDSGAESYLDLIRTNAERIAGALS